jgi:DNA polymerase III epsilon subunit-like protein
MSWKDGIITAIDVETTGLNPETDKIVEIGTAVMKQGRITLRHGKIVNPGIPIPEEATKIHGIKDEDVKDAPLLEEISQKFIDHVQKADALVAYNWIGEE